MMENWILLAVLVAVLNSLAVQVWLIAALRRERTVPSEPHNDLTEEELEAGRKAAEAQAKYEQGFVNLMCYDGMPAGKKEGMLR